MDEATVRDEHLASVHEAAHWLYLFGVLAVGLVLMLVLIAFLGSGAGS